MQQNRESPHHSKQIIFIIIIYLYLIISSYIASNPSAFNKDIIAAISNPEAPVPSPQQLLSIFSTNNYQGHWRCPDNNNCLLSQGEGKVSMKLVSLQNGQNEVEFKINNGIYIDDGKVTLLYSFSNSQLKSTRSSNSAVLTIYEYQNTSPQESKNSQALIYMTHSVKLKTVTSTDLYLRQATLNITPMAQSSTTPIIIFYFSAFQIEAQKQSLPIIQLQMQIQAKQSKIWRIVIFAVLLIALSLFQFSAIRAVLAGSEDANNYSVLTMLMATLWDAVICVIAFAWAFKSEESLMLLIIPSFMLCLVFINLEIRLLLIIFQVKSSTDNHHQVTCYFNLITFGSFISLYPILLTTNLAPSFFIFISLIFLPQIYENARLGKRPNVANAYYSKFLPSRFLIILYVKCFPWNIFELQPNYLLGFFCLLLIAMQMMLLWIQKEKGPKVVIPSFLLPPVYKYSCEIEMNQESGIDQSECAICLTPLDRNRSSNENSLSVPFRLMRGPCGHRYHGTCLSQWMQIKMECPQCRSKLPPFQ